MPSICYTLPSMGLVLRAVPLARGSAKVSACPWLCQSCAKSFFLLDSDAPFSVRSRPRFWCVFGHFVRSIFGTVFWPCLAVRKLCQRLFLTGFRRPVFGPQPASFLLRFSAFCARRAAAFPRFEGVRFRDCFVAAWVCQSFAKGSLLPDSDAPFSVRRPVFGP